MDRTALNSRSQFACARRSCFSRTSFGGHLGPRKLALPLSLSQFFVEFCDPPALFGEVWPNVGSSEAVRSESWGKFSDSVQLFAPGRCPMLLPHFLRKADYKRSYRSVPARAHRIRSFIRLVMYSRFELRFTSHGFRIRTVRAPALLAFSSAVGWVSGVRFDGEPPRVSVCISEAVRTRNEVLPQGNADVPSWTTAGGFSFLLDLHSHFDQG